MPYKVMISGKKRWRGQVYLLDGRSKQKLCDTKTEAEEWEGVMRAEMEAQANTPPPQPDSQKETPSDLLLWATAYLADTVRHAPKTVNEKRNVFKRLFEALPPTMPWSRLTKIEALKYIRNQFETRSGYAANKERKNLSAAWVWGQDFLDDFPQTNPWKAVKKFPEERTPRYVPSEKDFWAVVDAAKGQDKVMLLTLIYTGARKGEIFRLTWADVDFASGHVRLGSRKRMDGSMEYIDVPMEDELVQALTQHRKQAWTSHVFVQDVGRHMGKPYKENRDFPQALCREVGVREFGCHAIRHLTASVLANSTMPIVLVQKVLRHARLATTEKYVHAIDKAKPYLHVLRRKRSENVHQNVQKQEASRVAPLKASASS